MTGKEYHQLNSLVKTLESRAKQAWEDQAERKEDELEVQFLKGVKFAFETSAEALRVTLEVMNS